MNYYKKPFLSYDKQAQQLIKRGLIAEKPKLIKVLKNIGYYRFTGYLHIFKLENENYTKGITLEQIYDIYRFDRQLRFLVIDAIERFEIHIRTSIVHILSEKYGAFGYMERKTLKGMDEKTYYRFINKCISNYERSQEDFIKHFKHKYGKCHILPPYWMLGNIFDFGMIYTLYKGADLDTRRKVASYLNIDAKTLSTWLRTVNTIRNICAHHSRLWNRTFGSPRLPEGKEWDEIGRQNKKIFPILSVLKYSLYIIAPDTTWHQKFNNLLNDFPDIDLSLMGFPENWKENDIWKNNTSNN